MEENKLIHILELLNEIVLNENGMTGSSKELYAVINTIKDEKINELLNGLTTNINNSW